MTFALSDRFRRFASVGPTITMLVLVPVLNGCSETIQPSQHIIVEREVLISTLRIQPHQIIQTVDGNFIVAGERGLASAVALSKIGAELWKYEVAYAPGIAGQYQGKFSGVVLLANGDLLFCGSKFVANPDNPQHPGFHTMTTVLSGSGTLKLSNRIDPDDTSLHAADFTECSSSGEGALIFGFIFNPDSNKPLLHWLVKVDQDGKKEWEKVGNASDEFKPPFPASRATPSGGTFWSLTGAGLNEILRLTRVSSSGEVTNVHDFTCGNFLLHFDMVQPSNDRSFLCAPWRKEMTVFRLSDNSKADSGQIGLRDRLHSSFDAERGIGYVLTDGSFLVFGRIPTQTGDRSVIQLFDKAGDSLGFRGFDLRYPSIDVGSVYSLGNNRFLALRQHLNTGGTVMSWVRVE